MRGQNLTRAMQRCCHDHRIRLQFNSALHPHAPGGRRALDQQRCYLAFAPYLAVAILNVTYEGRVQPLAGRTVQEAYAGGVSCAREMMEYGGHRPGRHLLGWEEAHREGDRVPPLREHPFSDPVAPVPFGVSAVVPPRHPL